jgi:putative hemin transport protein
LQFFGKDGKALHKAFSTAKTDMAALEELIGRFRAEDQSPAEAVEAMPSEHEPAKADEDIDVAAFQEDWKQLQDTHDFHFMLRRHGVERRQSLRLAPEGMTQQLPSDSLPTLMEGMRDAGLNIMVFVGNPGIVQIHSGPIKKLAWVEPWYNVLDPGFHLHIREQAIEAIWVVRKPTEKGIVTGIECFNAAGDLIITFFGKRKAGESEMPAWRELVAELESRLVQA